MSFEIEKGIPLPKTGSGSRDPLVIALVQCEFGDSVFVPDELMDYMRVQYSIQKAAYRGGKFTRRKQPGGTRIWRIK